LSLSVSVCLCVSFFDVTQSQNTVQRSLVVYRVTKDSFLPRGAMLRAELGLAIAFLSVCTSVAHQYCVKTNEHSAIPSLTAHLVSGAI